SVLIMETELWPGFLRECRVRQIPVAVVNGRLSRQSFRRYTWIKGFLSRVLQSLSLAIMQTEDDASRIRKLGMKPSKTFVSGSLKFDAGTIPLPPSVADEFRERFNLAGNSPLILAASTHPPEETIMLEVLKRLRVNSNNQCRLLLAPRHPERFADVAALLKASGLSWTRRSNPADSADGNCDIILLDTIGELQAVYPLADVVFVGGSVAKTGGHNVLEPAAVGAAIVTGAHTFNFDAIVKSLVKDRALIQLRQMSAEETTSEIVRVFKDLLSDEEGRRDLGRRARELVERNLGATERTLDLLDSILKPSSGVSPQSQTERGGY
ncbi:MAG: 3-deoxy-D-manno-octulosonic acid transferase, partial [Pyrinomonadaceae bacterium]